MKSTDALLESVGEDPGDQKGGCLLFSSTSRRSVPDLWADRRTSLANSNRNQTASTAGNVVAMQIGNHADWPSLLLACLRQRPGGSSAGALDRRTGAQCGACSLRRESCSDHRLRKEMSQNCAAVEGPAAIGPPALERSRSSVAPQIHFRNDGCSARRPVSQRATSGRLRAHLPRPWASPRADLNFGVIPISHSYGFSNLLTPLIARGVPHGAEPATGSRAPCWPILAEAMPPSFPGCLFFIRRFAK